MRPRLRPITLLLLLLAGYVETHADTVKNAANAAGSIAGYPAKPVHMIDPFGAGGGPDLLARALAPKLSELWGQPVTVENHPGAGATTGPALVAKSPADGYTLLISTSAQAYSAALSKNLPYDPLKDFIPVASLTNQPYVLVAGRPAGITTVRELIAAAKVKPGELKFGSTGPGTGSHLGIVKFNLQSGIKAVDVPPQPTDAIADVLAAMVEGRTTYMIAPISITLAQIRDGKLFPLGVTTARRSALLPEVPTIAEAGVAGFDFPIWYGIWAPAGTPAGVVDKLSKDIARVLAGPDLRDWIAKHGGEPMNMTQPEFARFVQSESEGAARLITAAGIRPSADATPGVSLDRQAAERFAALALKCLHAEYPSHISHTMDTDADARPPHELTPAFYGCYDWHSDVHGHWLLVRLLRLFPDAPFAPQARSELALSLTPQAIAGEVAYFKREGRASFERPYGIAWLLRLAGELRAWKDPEAQAWSSALRELEVEAASRVKAWVPKLHYPIRVGEHDQTAFSFGLIWDWAGIAGDSQMRALLSDAAGRFYLHDRNCPLNYEPSGEDFLSPCLAEADFMRRVMKDDEFGRWLSGFLPGIPRSKGGAWLQPAVVTDRSDPKLAHLDGLNLSRAWMLEGIAHGLRASDRRVPVLLELAKRHRDAALPAVTGEHYEGGHWLGTFAVYLTTGAGLAN